MWIRAPAPIKPSPSIPPLLPRPQRRRRRRKNWGSSKELNAKQLFRLRVTRNRKLLFVMPSSTVPSKHLFVCFRMKDFYIRDCAAHENQNITSSFTVTAKQVKAKKNGEPYLALSLADRSGSLEAKAWDNVADMINAFDQDNVVKVKGLLNKYNNRWQLTIHKLRRMEESESDFTDYLPTTTKDVEELWRTLGAFVASMSNPYLKTLLEAFMGDAEIATAYKNAPAAKTLHHAFIGGGLRPHTLTFSCR